MTNDTQEDMDESGRTDSATMKRRDVIAGLGAAGVFAAAASGQSQDSVGATIGGGPMSSEVSHLQIEWAEGEFGERPDAGVEGRYFYIADESDDRHGNIYRDDGSSWSLINLGAGAINAERATIGGVQISREQDATFYVDEANGDDTADGTSVSTAFASYERAFEEVARFTESKIDIRQIGDYDSEVRIQGRVAGPQSSARGVYVNVIGDSEIDGRGADPGNMESINADLKIYGCVGVKFEFLHLNGRVWWQGSQNMQAGKCKLGSGGTLFIYCKGSTGSISKCEFDPQSQNPSYGVFSSAGSFVGVGGNTTFDNWNPNANTWLFANGGVIYDDEWEDGNEYKMGDVTRDGLSLPADGFALGYPAIDRGLRGKSIHELREVSNASASDLASGEWVFDDNRGGSGNSAWLFKDAGGTLHYLDFDGTV